MGQCRRGLAGDRGRNPSAMTRFRFPTGMEIVGGIKRLMLEGRLDEGSDRQARHMRSDKPQRLVVSPTSSYPPPDSSGHETAV